MAAKVVAFGPFERQKLGRFLPGSFAVGKTQKWTFRGAQRLPTSGSLFMSTVDCRDRSSGWLAQFYPLWSAVRPP